MMGKIMKTEHILVKKWKINIMVNCFGAVSIGSNENSKEKNTDK